MVPGAGSSPPTAPLTIVAAPLLAGRVEEVDQQEPLAHRPLQSGPSPAICHSRLLQEPFDSAKHFPAAYQMEIVVAGSLYDGEFPGSAQSGDFLPHAEGNHLIPRPVDHQQRRFEPLSPVGVVK